MRTAPSLGPLVLVALVTACFFDRGGETAGEEATSDGACEPRRVAYKSPNPKVVLMLDKSVAMAAKTWDHDDDPNTQAIARWPALYAVVSTIHASIYTTVELGLKLFPDRGATADDPTTLCGVGSNVEVLTQLYGRDEVVESMPAANAGLGGRTPTAAGLQGAIAHLSAADPTIPRAVLLVAGEAANCQAGVDGEQSGEVLDSGAVATAQAGLAAGIRTYVIGLGIPAGLTPVDPDDGVPDGVDAFASLQAIAVAGGTATAYDARSQDDLSAAFTEVLGTRVIPCDGIAAPTADGEEVVGVALKSGDAALPVTEPCGDGPGWHLSGGADGYVSLCGSTCAGYRASRSLFFDVACK